MPYDKITDLVELTQVASGDFLPIVDVSDTSQAATGSTRKVKMQNISGQTIVLSPTGTNDDVNIQAAINQIIINGGGKLLLKSGIFNISKAISILGSNITIVGEGADTELKAVNGLNDNIFTVGDAINIYSNLTFRDLYLEGNQVNQSVNSISGILFKKCNFSTIDNIIANNFVTYGIDFENASKYNKVSNGQFNNNGFDGIDINASSYLTVINSVLNSNGHAGMLVNNSTNVSFTNNVCDGNQSIAVTTGQYISVIGNVISNTLNGSGFGCVNLSDSVFSGNTVFLARFNGVNGDGLRRTIISNNQFVNGGQATASVTAGVKLFRSSGSWESSNNIIMGNSIIDTQNTPTQDWGILELNSSDYNTYIGNYFAGNISGSRSLVGVNNIVANNNG